MPITLQRNDTLVSLTLPSDLIWVDEFTWQPVQQSKEYTSTGALIIDVAAKQAGRPITLEADESAAWILRGLLRSLRAWAALPGKTFTLTLDDAVPRQVAFDHESAPVNATPIVAYADPVDTDFYKLTLKFLEL